MRKVGERDGSEGVRHHRLRRDRLTLRALRFDGRVAVVAGGARGIGEAVVRALVDEGARVAIGDIRMEQAEQLADDLAPAVTAHQFDVRDPDDCEALIDAAISTFGQVDHLVNTALQHAPGSLLELTREAWNQVVEIGLTGSFLMCQAFGRRVVDQGSGGSIVNISSLAGLQPYDGTGAYSTVKAGLTMLSRQLALEWADSSIRVNIVSPGHIDTPLTAYLQDPEIRRARSEATPIGRVGDPADVANAALFLLSDDAEYVTGAELVVDGGLSNTIFWKLPGRRFA